jgi:asparagine synthase (glutamine-hydrolysing)
MNPARLAVPLVGVVARTERGRRRMNAEALHTWVEPWLGAPDPDAWWMDAEAGVAIFRPESRAGTPGDEAVLAIRGVVIEGGVQGRAPRGWPELPPPAGAGAILYDLLERDVAAVRAMRGQFALAWWDGRRRRLVLARDHLGQRALYLRAEPDVYVFSSELAPLLRAGGRRTLDAESAVWYLAFGVPVPGRTLALGVERVPAAHVVAWEPGQPLQQQRYWTPLVADAPRGSGPEEVEALRGSLDAALARHLRPGTEHGIFLSGGVDSTYLAATSVAMGVNPVAFTSAFETRHGMNETEYAAAVAGWLGLEHQVVELGAGEAARLLDDVVLSAAAPCSAWATLTHFRVLAAARHAGVERMLSGLGADEVFGGYDHFRGFYARYLRWRARGVPARGIDPADAALLPETADARRLLYPGVARFFDDVALRDSLAEPYRGWQYASHLRAFYRECRRLKPETEPLEAMVAHECQHRIPDLLFANFEPISRRMGVEVSYPFLDPDLVQRAAALSVESRYRTPSGRFSLRLRELQPRFKHALLRVAEPRIPPEILNRPRKSFTAPFGGWMVHHPRFRAAVLERVMESGLWDAGIVKREALDRTLERLTPGPGPAAFRLWALITLAGWYDRYAAP